MDILRLSKISLCFLDFEKVFMVHTSYQCSAPFTGGVHALHLYPKSDRVKTVSNCQGALQRAMEVNLSPAEVNCLYDGTGQMKRERSQALSAHKQSRFNSQTLSFIYVYYLFCIFNWIKTLSEYLLA